MRNIIIFSLLSIITSCTTNKSITDYIVNRKEAVKPEKIYIYENKMNVNVTLDILKNQHLNKKSTSKYYTYEDYLLIKDKYKNDTLIEKWSNSDFKNSGCILINNNLIDLKKNNPEVFTGKRLFFAFSKPLFLKTKNEVIIYVSESTEFGRSTFSGILIMMKKNKKWEILEKIENPDLN